MKKIFSILSVLLITFTACKKENKVDSLQNLANEIKIYTNKVFAKDAIVSYVLDNLPSGYTTKLQMKKSTETVWQDVTVVDKNNVALSALNMKTQYDLRVLLTSGTETRYSKIVNFTTKSFLVNYNQFFTIPSNLHDNGNAIFSIEGAHYVISGEGFTNESSISVNLVAVDNATDVTPLKTTIINDSTLSFDIPSNFVANEPYAVSKTYNCNIGNVPLIGYAAYLNQNYELLADMTIVNRDIQINSFTTDPFACKSMDFGGNFATHETATVCPEFAYSVSMWTISKKLIIRSGTTILKEIVLQPSGSTVCDGNGLAEADLTALAKSMIAYHEVKKINIKTTLASGSYTAQLKQTFKDGIVIYSNEFPFSF